MKKIFLLLLLFNLSLAQNTAKKIILFDYDMYTVSTPAKAFGQVVQYIDGTLSSTANEFVDKSGNGYNLDIINRDFNCNYFPYKSAAMVAQKAANFGKIYDPTNFWFTSGGTPNQIPVNSIFQNVDYANNIFSKHRPQLINGDSTEYQEPAIVEIVTYSTALTGANLTNASSYFGVPTEITSNVIWVDPVNGSNANSGTKASKFQTLEKANTLTSGKTIYIMTGAVTVTASIFFLDSQKWKFIGYSPITSTASPVLSTSASNSVTVEGAVVTPASGGRAFYFISGNNDTLRRCKAIANGSGSKCFQTLAGTSNHLQNCVFISSQDQPCVDIRAVAPNIYGCYFSGSPSVEPLSWNTTNIATGQKIYYNKFTFTLASGKNLFLFNKAGNYYVKFNSFTTSGGAGLQSLLAGTSMVGTIHYKYNDIRPKGMTNGVICHANTTNTVTYNISNNTFIIDATNSLPNSIVQLVEQPAPTINNNFIDNYTSNGAITFNATAAKGAADVSYNTIFSRADGGQITVGSDASASYDNSYNGTTVIGNKLYGIWYFNPSSVTNVNHGIAIFNCVNTQIKYNYVNGANHLVVIKASDRATAVTNTNCVVAYNIGINNDGALFPKTMQGILFYNNTTYADNPNIQLMGGGVYLLGSTGPAINNTFKNNIFIDKTPLNSAISVIRADPATSLGGLLSDNNVIYSQYNSIAKVINPGTTTYSTLASWQAAGYDASSLNTNVLFNSNSNEQWWPTSSILNGENLGSPFDYGLDITSKWFLTGISTPIINTKQQTGTWQNGAYVQ